MLILIVTQAPWKKKKCPPLEDAPSFIVGSGTMNMCYYRHLWDENAQTSGPYPPTKQARTSCVLTSPARGARLPLTPEHMSASVNVRSHAAGAGEPALGSL